jgi:hypothetical protein
MTAQRLRPLLTSPALLPPLLTLAALHSVEGKRVLSRHSVDGLGGGII